MKTTKFIRSTTKKIKNTISEIVSINNSVMNDIILINIKRLFYVSILSMFASFASIFLFSMDTSLGDENKINWRMGVVFTHIISFFTMLVLGCFSLFLTKKEKVNFLMRLIQSIAIVSILIFGITVVSIDQLVSDNITPFIIVCTVTGVVFLLRPVWAIITYSGTFIVFYYAIGLTQTEQEILLSNRVNGITVIGLGICSSLIAWKTNVSNILQKRFIATQQKELEEKNRELEYLAFYDPMTSLYNRRRSEELINKEISMICRYGHESCIIILDIDNFKQINDNYGHPVGDMVLKEIASTLKNNVRKTDVVSRWGGEEFLIILTHVSLSDGKVIAEKLRKIIEDNILFIQERALHITASFGVARLRSCKNDSLVAYKDADKALYHAKEEGRNRVVISKY